MESVVLLILPFQRLITLARWLSLFGVVEGRIYRSLQCVGRLAEDWLGLALVLNFDDLRIDLLVLPAASVSLEKEGKDKFSRNILYSTAMPWRQKSAIVESQQSKGFS